MLLLILSVTVLWLAPAVQSALAKRFVVPRWADRLLVALLAIVVVLAILPESFAVAGWLAIACAAWGLVIPSIAERMFRTVASGVHWVPLLFGTLGLALHASLDGAAFVNPVAHQHHVHSMLPYAVIVHRFFEGTFIWWTVRPRFGRGTTAGVLAFNTAFTLFGYAAGDHYFHLLETDLVFALFQSVVAGSLLHLALDRHDHAGHTHGAPSFSPRAAAHSHSGACDHSGHRHGIAKKISGPQPISKGT